MALYYEAQGGKLARSIAYDTLFVDDFAKV